MNCSECQGSWLYKVLKLHDSWVCSTKEDNYTIPSKAQGRWDRKDGRSRRRGEELRNTILWGWRGHCNHKFSTTVAACTESIQEPINSQARMRNGSRRPMPPYFCGQTQEKGVSLPHQLCIYWSPHQTPKDSFKTMVTPMVLVRLNRSKHQTKNQESEKETGRKEWILIGIEGNKKRWWREGPEYIIRMNEIIRELS